MTCQECKYAPKTYAEYCMALRNPTVYCPDAYTEVAHLCGNREEKDTSSESEVISL